MPKMLIDAGWKTLLQWSIDSLPLALCTNLICVILQEDESNFQISQKISQLYWDKVKLSFLFLDKITNGQAETVYKAKELLLTDRGLLIFNIDTYFSSHTLKDLLTRDDIDGLLWSFCSHNANYSYARIDNEWYIEKTAEKEVISPHALTGLYFFKSVLDYLEAFDFSVRNNLKVKNEFYISPMYNYLIQKWKKFILDFPDKTHILWTPIELDYFIKNFYDII